MAVSKSKKNSASSGGGGTSQDLKQSISLLVPHGLIEERYYKVKDLRNMIHPTAQRPPSWNWVREHALRFDPALVGVLTACEYMIPNFGMGPHVVDGQGRILMMYSIERLREFEQRVMVVTGPDLCDRDAARLFLGLNDRRPVTIRHSFSQEVKAEFPVAVGLSSVCAKRNLTVSPGRGDSNVCAIVTAKRLWSLDKGATLSIALDLALSAWGYTYAALEGTLLSGICHLVYHTKHKLDFARTVKILHDHPEGPGHLRGKAIIEARDGHTSSSRAMAIIIANSYNRGLAEKKRINPL